MSAFPVPCGDLASLQLFWVFAAIKSYHTHGSGESTFGVTGDQCEVVILLPHLSLSTLENVENTGVLDPRLPLLPLHPAQVQTAQQEGRECTPHPDSEKPQDLMFISARRWVCSQRQSFLHPGKWKLPGLTSTEGKIESKRKEG